jgi:hypothetical protein
MWIRSGVPSPGLRSRGMAGLYPAFFCPVAAPRPRNLETVAPFADRTSRDAVLLCEGSCRSSPHLLIEFLSGDVHVFSPSTV